MRFETVTVTFRTDDGVLHVHTPRQPERPITAFSPGSKHEVTVEGGRLTLHH